MTLAEILNAMPNQQSTAAANALSGEKSFRTVSFAITGDEELDLIAGILKVLEPDNDLRNRLGDLPPVELRLRVLRYLTNRFEAIQHQQERQTEQAKNDWARYQQLGSIGQGLGAAPPGSIAYPQQAPPWYTTSSGTPPNLLYNQDWHAQYEAYKASQSANAAAQQIHDYNSLHGKTASEQTRLLKESRGSQASDFGL
jgi:hypothetical protein